MPYIEEEGAQSQRSSPTPVNLPHDTDDDDLFIYYFNPLDEAGEWRTENEE